VTAPFGRKEALAIKPGNLVTPLRLWNESTGNPSLRLAPQVPVLAVAAARSQTGVVFEVESEGGERLSLDAGWFRL